MTSIFIVCPTCKGSGVVKCSQASCHTEKNSGCVICFGDQTIDCWRCNLSRSGNESMVGVGVAINEKLTAHRELIIGLLAAYSKGANL